MAAGPASAITPDELYRATPSVTGTEEPERQRGFRAGLEDVIVKLTGDATLQGSDRIAPLLQNAGNYVLSHSYRDEMEGIPKHDEQGTRDRPHTLTIEFDKAKLDAALEALDMPLWRGDRPVTAIFLGIKDMRASYVLSADGQEAYGQREVIRYVSRQRGVPVVLPAMANLKTGPSYEAVAAADTNAMIVAAKDLGAHAILSGALNFDGDAYWNITWTFVWWGHDLKTWTDRGVTFDKSLRHAIEKAASIYSHQAKTQ